MPRLSQMAAPANAPTSVPGSGGANATILLFDESHIAWSKEQLAERPELNADALAAFGHNMWDHPFVFCVDRAFVRNCPVPTFLLPGTDIPHPAATSTAMTAHHSVVSVGRSSDA